MRQGILPARRDALANLAWAAVAGITAAFATSFFQRAWAAFDLPPTDRLQPDPPTQRLALKIALALTGRRLGSTGSMIGGEAVHYAMGAALGVAYSQMSRCWPEVAAGHGSAFGLGVWATVEEGGLALLELKPPPWDVGIAEHIFAASSHLVFGVVLNAAWQSTPQAGSVRGGQRLAVLDQ